MRATRVVEEGDLVGALPSGMTAGAKIEQVRPDVRRFNEAASIGPVMSPQWPIVKLRLSTKMLARRTASSSASRIALVKPPTRSRCVSG